jgi:hypothetical protein
VVVYGEPQALFAAQIPLGCFHRNMTQEELDLLKFPAGSMAEPRAGTAIMPHAALEALCRIPDYAE